MKPEAVIRSYLAMTGLFTLAGSMIWGVNTLFLLGAGLDIFEVFIANGAFTLAMTFLEIPTGVIADTWGRRVSFLLSMATLLLGTLGYVGVAASGGGLTGFVLWSCVLGLGFTFYSGAMEAWLVDALNATEFDGQMEQVFARAQMVGSVAMLIGTLGGGILASFDLSFPYYARSVLLGIVFLIAWFGMVEVGYEPKSLRLADVLPEMQRITRESVAHGWAEPSIRLLIIASALQAFFMDWGYHSWQPYFLGLLQSDAAWIAGVIAAGTSISTMVGNGVVDYFTRFCGRRTTLMMWAIGIQFVCILGVGLAPNFWVAVSLYMVVMATTGVYSPVRQAYVHELTTEHRATVLSFDSLVRSGGSFTGMTGLGFLSRQRGIASGYVISGLVVATALPLLLKLRRRYDGADFITGSAGNATCAAQGLPLNPNG